MVALKSSEAADREWDGVRGGMPIYWYGWLPAKYCCEKSIFEESWMEPRTRAQVGAE